MHPYAHVHVTIAAPHKHAVSSMTLHCPLAHGSLPGWSSNFHDDEQSLRAFSALRNKLQSIGLLAFSSVGLDCTCMRIGRYVAMSRVIKDMRLPVTTAVSLETIHTSLQKLAM